MVPPAIVPVKINWVTLTANTSTTASVEDTRHRGDVGNVVEKLSVQLPTTPPPTVMVPL